MILLVLLLDSAVLNVTLIQNLFAYLISRTCWKITIYIQRFGHCLDWNVLDTDTKFSIWISITCGDRKPTCKNTYGYWISERPKFGIGWWYWLKVSVLEQIFFFLPKLKLSFFSNFTHFFLLLREIQVFISLGINLALQK